MSLTTRAELDRLEAELERDGEVRYHLLDPCDYPAHRSSDWTTRDAAGLICGICHPPALEHVILRGERGFDPLERAWRFRQRRAELEGIVKRRHELELLAQAREQEAAAP